MKHQPHIIHCIGDSHAGFFSGRDTIQPVWPEPAADRLPPFRSYRLGPVLAYNLCRDGTRSGGREKLFDLIQNHLPPASTVLLCFGEIDCRAHLILQARQSDRPLLAVAHECADRYFGVVQEVAKLGVTPLIWAAIPSTPLGRVPNRDFPVVGSCRERNEATRLFNARLERRCAEAGIGFVSIFDQLVDATGLTRAKFYSDNLHLSQRAMPLALAAIAAAAPWFHPPYRPGDATMRSLRSLGKRIITSTGDLLAAAAHRAGRSPLFAAIDQQLARTAAEYRRGVWAHRLEKLGRDAVIDPTVSIEQPQRVTIGEGSRLGARVTIDGSAGVAIGGRVVVEAGAALATRLPREDYLDMWKNPVGGPIVIQDGAWIGHSAVVLAGVTVGRGAIVMPGAVVRENVAPGTVIAGVAGEKPGLRFVAAALDESLPTIRLDDLAPPLPASHRRIDDDLIMPPFAKNQRHDDYSPLMRIVHALKPRLVFEYGTAQGATVANICANSEAVVYTLNALPEQMTGEAVTFALTPDVIGRAYRNNGFAQRVRQIFSDSLRFEPAGCLQPSSLDLVVVDACHDAAYVLSDFLKLVDYVRPGGVVLLHDTHPSQEGHLGGSYAACCVLRARGFDVKHIEGTWWGCWVKPGGAARLAA